MLEDCDEENSSEDFSLNDSVKPAVPWPANVSLSNGIKRQDQMFFNFFGMYTVESIKAQNKEVTSDV
jgi:hypothetical protein